MALSVVITMPLLGLSGVATAKTTKAGKGSATWCAKHPKKVVCQAGAGSGTGSGSGGTAPEITIDASNAPIITVEANPQFAGDVVDVESSQLQAACGGVLEFLSVQNGFLEPYINSIPAVLDDDGNATFIMTSPNNCAPGVNLVEASMAVAPFLTATDEDIVYPDYPTPAGVFAYPNPQVEVGDTATSGDSDVYAAFAIETSPVYAEGEAEISDAQLEASCLGGYYWIDGYGVPHFVPAVAPGQLAQTIDPPVDTPIDDDGNGGVLFIGISCATATTDVIGDVLGGDHPTYTSTFTVLPPAPTI